MLLRDRIRSPVSKALRPFDVTQYQESKIRGSRPRKVVDTLETLVSNKANASIVASGNSFRLRDRFSCRSRRKRRMGRGNGTRPLTRPLGGSRARERDHRVSETAEEERDEGGEGRSKGGGKEAERHPKAKRAPADFWDPAKNAWARSPRGLAERRRRSHPFSSGSRARPFPSGLPTGLVASPRRWERVAPPPIVSLHLSRVFRCRARGWSSLPASLRPILSSPSIPHRHRHPTWVQTHTYAVVGSSI